MSLEHRELYRTFNSVVFILAFFFLSLKCFFVHQIKSHKKFQSVRWGHSFSKYIYVPDTGLNVEKRAGIKLCPPVESGGSWEPLLISLLRLSPSVTALGSRGSGHSSQIPHLDSLPQNEDTEVRGQTTHLTFYNLSILHLKY